MGGSAMDTQMLVISLAQVLVHVLTNILYKLQMHYHVMYRSCTSFGIFWAWITRGMENLGKTSGETVRIEQTHCRGHLEKARSKVYAVTDTSRTLLNSYALSSSMASNTLVCWTFQWKWHGHKSHKVVEFPDSHVLANRHHLFVHMWDSDVFFVALSVANFILFGLCIYLDIVTSAFQILFQTWLTKMFADLGLSLLIPQCLWIKLHSLIL